MLPDHLDALLREQAPKDLFQWAYQAMLASLPQGEFMDAWAGILQYLGWLDQLPCDMSQH